MTLDGKPRPTHVHHVPKSWNRWKFRCRYTRQTGIQCRSWARPGCWFCVHHGASGEMAETGWRRYCVWVMLGSPPNLLTKSGVVAVAEEVAAYCIGDKSGVSATVRLNAACALWDSLYRKVAAAEAHELLARSIGDGPARRAVRALTDHNII